MTKMKWDYFETSVPGKWVLAGEHSVLRGGAAIAMPHPGVGLDLKFQPDPTGQDLKILPSDSAKMIEGLILSILEVLKNGKGQTFKPAGLLEIKSTIPVGAGLGSSAALCVAMTRWIGRAFQIPLSQWVEIATQLEHRFHGKSSGMDVSVIALGEPISFAKGQGASSLGITKLPRFTFHDTGIRCRTSDCVLKVESLRDSAPVLALSADAKMAEASGAALEGLIRYSQGNPAQGLDLLKGAIREAQNCFYSWDLVPTKAKEMEQDLLDHGALAVKLTGAGGGGMLVALWPDSL